MAKFVFTDASLVVDSVDLSEYVESVTVGYSSDAVESTAMGSTARSYEPGLTDSTISVTFFQDYAATKVDATLFGLIGAAATTLVVKPTSDAVGTDNPSFTVSAILNDYSGPVDASVGDAAKASATFQCTTALVRATS
jgi:hypothetical protein